MSRDGYGLDAASNTTGWFYLLSTMPFNQGGDRKAGFTLVGSANAHLQLQLDIETGLSCHTWIIRIKSVAALVGVGRFSHFSGACVTPTWQFEASTQPTSSSRLLSPHRVTATAPLLGSSDENLPSLHMQHTSLQEYL